MRTDRTADGALSPELEAIATAAHDGLKAQAGEDLSAIDQAGRRVAEAASAAIAAGPASPRSPTPNTPANCAPARNSAATSCGRSRAPASARREADREYEQAIGRAGGLGLSHREIATAAEISHGTIRAILTRGTTITTNGRLVEEEAPPSEPGDGAPREMAA